VVPNHGTLATRDGTLYIDVTEREEMPFQIRMDLYTGERVSPRAEDEELLGG
jgi:hypothetical protein